MPTPSDLLATELRRDGSRPVLTWYDDATGERIELSVATLANWVAKTAGWLVDEHDMGPGDVVAVLLPAHWQAAVVMLAAWAAGGGVAFDADAAYALAVCEPDRVDEARLQLAGDEVVELSLAPMGVDFSRLVAGFPDDFVALAASGDEIVESLPTDLAADARVLSVLPLSDAAGLGYGLLAPLAGGGSVVLVRNADAGRLPQRCVEERVTHTLGVDVAGLPRLDSHGHGPPA